MGFCQNCERFDIQSWAAKKKDESQTRLIPCFQLVDGANSGCEFCIFLMESFMDEYPEETKEVLLGTMVKFEPLREPIAGETGMAISWIVITLDHRDDAKSISISFAATAEKDSPATLNQDVVGIRLANNPMWGGYIQRIRNWLQTCQSSHAECKKTISGQVVDCTQAELPTRCIVVDTGSFDVSQAITYHLEETENKTGAYIALSHKWSEDTEVCKTTTDNYRNRLAGKDLNLPILFNDALRFAWTLGIKYVWIDSICIIQAGDEGQDWDKESLRMKNYYTNSYVTLAAGIPDRTKGLALGGLAYTSLQRLGRLPYRNKEGKKDGYFYLYRRSPKIQDAYRKTVSEGHLLKRGWVFQEWCLSRRVICFASASGGQRIFYHCRSEKPRNEYGFQVSVKEIPFWGRDDHFKDATFVGVWDYWHTAVENYSRAQLSEPEKDRIIALTGMANECKARLRSIWEESEIEIQSTMEFYVAGLWLQDIHRGLLWEQDCERGAPRERLESFPTWSWASITIPVRWRPHKYQEWLTRWEKISGDNAETWANCNNKFTFLQLKCRLIPIIVRDNFSEESWEQIRTLADVPDKEHANACFEHPLIRNICKVCPKSEPWTIHGWGSFEHPEYQHEESFSTAETVYGLPISRYGQTMSVLFVRAVRAVGGVESEVEGGVLGSDEEQYERVGVGRLMDGAFQEEYESAEERLLWLR